MNRINSPLKYFIEIPVLKSLKQGKMINTREVVEASIQSIWKTIRFIKRRVSTNPEKYFKPRYFETPSGPKYLRRIDDAAEVYFESVLSDYKKGTYEKELIFWGEESFYNPNLDLTGIDKVIVLMDIIDGTDLLMRMLSNWCSALIFLKPKSKKILASLIGFPSMRIYGWCADIEPNPFWVKPTKPLDFKPLKGANKNVKQLEEASICFYGQKVDNFLSFLEDKKFMEFMNKLKSTERNLRIYNIAGNPMMIRVAEGDIDVVVELTGQKPHDVVPGAYIAWKAGAVFKDLHNNNIDLEKILLKPAHPKSEIKYILASTEELYQDIRRHLTNS